MTRTIQPIRASEREICPPPRAEDVGRSSSAGQPICRTFEMREGVNLMRKIIATLAIASTVVGASAAHAGTRSEWEHYRSRVSGNVIVIKTRCETEDSLAHLREVDYRDGGGHVVLGCYRKGY